ncbi:hypothetical protein [Streptomyces sp. NPDC059209]|uniref:hypothetical protein n=1 Tax=Streptomyces sp. NPDC059209 TaxID=3346769 RepID=UPI0036830DF5
MTWHSYLVGKDDVVTVYWFAQDPYSRGDYVVRALKAESRSVPCKGVDVTGTPDEIADWTAAATAYVDEAAAALSELYRVERRTSWRRSKPVVRRWAEANYEEAKASYVSRIRAATSAYQPVRDAVEARIAQQEAARLEAAKQAQQERERRHREGEARLEAWKRRQAVADRPLPGGRRTPRQMAARGERPPSWPPEMEAEVGDLATWWAEVCVSVRNERARSEAVQRVTKAITSTAAALKKAGEPGIRAVKEKPEGVLYGWWVDFTWSDLPDIARLETPPDAPVDHLHGEWRLYRGLLPSRILFTRKSDGYELATVYSESHSSYPLFKQHRWQKQGIEEFAERLFPVEIYLHDHRYKTLFSARLTDHVDPAVFVPYVQAVSKRAVDAFHALGPGRG